jgi:hypothetical protein
MRALLPIALVLASTVASAAAEPVRVVFDVAPADCAATIEDAASVAGVPSIHVDLAGPAPPCIGPRLAAALLAALERGGLDELARERALPCDPRCWLDRPTAAIARVGHRRDLIWPPPPPSMEGDELVFFLCSPDLNERWLWIAVSRVEDGRITARVTSDDD